MKTLAIAILAIPVLLMLSAFLTMILSKSGMRGKMINKEQNSLRKEAEELRIDADTRRVKKFGFVWVLPSALTILRLLNFKQFLLTCTKRPTIYRLNPQTTKKIVLFAIYEKGEIRDDVRSALRELHALECTVILVNSRKLSEASRNELAQWTTTYIERPNYGRDFGSYKDGMLWIYKHLSEEFMNVERFMILNDSVFYARSNLPQFFSALLNTQAPVFGATMNYQKVPHIGSFCISLSGKVAQHPKLKSFWKKYRKTDLRAHTIRYGELALNKLLSRISPSDPALDVLFTGSDVTRMINRDEALLKVLFDTNRSSNRTSTVIRNNVRVEMMRMNFHIDWHGTDAVIEKATSGDHYSFAGTFEDGFEAFKRGVHGDDKNLYEVYKKSVAAAIGNEFDRESQIHTNSTILPYLGCAIIKLDLEYRGVIDAFDRITICNALEPDEADILSKILSSRPWGEETLSGWRLSAFQWGHL